VIQLLYMATHFALRPMGEVKDQLLEMVNEVIYATLVVILAVWTQESDWSNLHASLYIWLMISNNIVFWVISAGKSLTWQ